MLKKIIISLIILLINLSVVNAECDYKTLLELNTSASNVNAYYNIEKRVVDYAGIEHPEISEEVAESLDSGYVKMDFIILKVENVNENIYIKFSNLTENEENYYYFNDLDNGTLTIKVPDTLIIRNYQIKIFSNISECIDEELRTIDIATPMYNTYSTSSLCENNNSYYCNEYVTTKVDIDIESLLEKKQDEEENEEKNNIQVQNIYPIIIISIVVGLICLFTCLIILFLKFMKN